MNRCTPILLIALFLCLLHLASVAQTHRLDSLEAELNAAQRSGKRDTFMIKIVQDLAWEHRPRNPTRALQLAFDARLLAEHLGDKRWLASSLNTVGNMYRFQGRYDSAMVYLKQAHSFAEVCGDKREIAVSIGSIGLVYQARGLYDKAVEHHLRALRLREQLGDQYGMAYSYTNLCALYHEQKAYSVALEFAYKAASLRQKLNDQRALAYLWTDIGVLHESQGRVDSAAWYFANAHALSERLNDKQGLANALSAKARLAFANRQFDSANLFQTRSVTLRRALNDRRGLAEALCALGEMNLAQQRLITAQTALDEAAALAESIGALPQRYAAYRQLSSLAAKRYDYPMALDLLQRASRLKDSMFTEEAARTVTALRVEYEDERKSKEIAFLRHQQELQRAAHEYDATMRNFLSGGCVLLLVVVGLLVNRFRLKARSQAALQQANSELAEANFEIQRQLETLNEQAKAIELANTQLQQFNEVLGEQNLRLMALDKEKNDLMGIVAHDLKNPIGTVLGIADLLHSGEVRAEDVSKMSGQIVQTSNRMLDLVKNLLDINRLETGAMQLHLVTIDIAPTVEGAVWSYLEAAQAKQISIHFINKASEEFLSTIIRADEQAIQQVWDNLVSNAVKYSPKGKNIVVRVQASSTAVRVEVQDEGPGISAEDMTRLFGKFARLRTQPTGGEHSTGLGLSIVKKLVEGMNGRVWCESEEGKGATFVVEFPVVQ